MFGEESDPVPDMAVDGTDSVNVVFDSFPVKLTIIYCKIPKMPSTIRIHVGHKNEVERGFYLDGLEHATPGTFVSFSSTLLYSDIGEADLSPFCYARHSDRWEAK